MNNRKKIAVLLTSYNRCEKTKKCIESLVKANSSLDFRFIVTDDGSTDGTGEMLEALPYRIHGIKGDGHLYWGGGMRKSFAYGIKNADSFDYALIINDDVEFFEGTVEAMIRRLEDTGAHIVAGATCNEDNQVTYGGVVKTSKVLAKFKVVAPSEEAVLCDTFNCNCVLMISQIFKSAGNIDKHYIHSMGDYDYGLSIRRRGFIIINSQDFVGLCNDNDVSETWRERTLSRKERLRLKESPKGLPAKDWAYFTFKNYGPFTCIYHTITPYIRILLGL